LATDLLERFEVATRDLMPQRINEGDADARRF
jgi:hypothetical protein